MTSEARPRGAGSDKPGPAVKFEMQGMGAICPAIGAYERALAFSVGLEHVFVVLSFLREASVGKGHPKAMPILRSAVWSCRFESLELGVGKLLVSSLGSPRRVSTSVSFHSILRLVTLQPWDFEASAMVAPSCLFITVFFVILTRLCSSSTRNHPENPTSHTIPTDALNTLPLESIHHATVTC